jgi:hypothetical protein
MVTSCLVQVDYHEHAREKEGGIKSSLSTIDSFLIGFFFIVFDSVQ